jgi:hypothetical protein
MSMFTNILKDDMFTIIVVAAAAYYMMTDMCKTNTEGFEDSVDIDMPMPQKGVAPKDQMNVAKITAYETSGAAPVGYNQQIATNSGSGCDNLKFVSTNLLPKGGDDNMDTSFTEFSPANLEGQNFIDSRNFTLGMQSQVLRNANLQLRSEPQNPQEPVCSWNQSTIVPETRRPLQLN